MLPFITWVSTRSAPPCSGAAEPRPEGQRYNSLDVVSTTWGEAGRKFQPRSISLDFPEHHRYLAPAWHAAPAQAVAAVSILCAIVVLGAPPASPIPLPPLTGSTFSRQELQDAITPLPSHFAFVSLSYLLRVPSSFLPRLRQSGLDT